MRTGLRCSVFVLAAAVALCVAPSAGAAVINSTVTGCASSPPYETCTIEPIGGPIAVDPLGFTLNLQWGPDFLWYIEDSPGQYGFLHLYFSYTGTHDGTENMGDVTFLDVMGNPTAVWGSNDDVSAVGGVATWTHYIFGPSSFIHGLTLGPSDGSGVTTMAFTRATIYPAQLVSVPEPSALLLLGLGVGLAGLRRAVRET